MNHFNEVLFMKYRIEKLKIKCFKSIRDVEISCRRVNVFIGPPNAGKSNILESIGLLSFVFVTDFSLHQVVRFELMPELFFDQDIHKTIHVNAEPILTYTLSQKKGMYELITQLTEGVRFSTLFDITGRSQDGLKFEKARLCPIRFYRFKPMQSWPRIETEFLLPPHGENLFSVIQTHTHVKEWVAGFFESFGQKLVLKPPEQKIEFLKEKDNVIYSFPYYLSSDTIQHIVLYQTALLSNTNAVIFFEEPEAHSFPFYTKQFAESISRTTNNQFFISTHNPYFLLTLIEKTPIEELAVFLVKMAQDETQIKSISEKMLQKALDYDIDVFFNLDELDDGA